MTKQIDEAVLSRQLYTIGKDAQLKIMNTRVLIYGLTGLGAEIAKNIILMSVKSVSFLDTKTVTIEDLGINFFLQSNHIGKNIAEATISSFQELNNSVKVSVESRQILDDSIFRDYEIIVVTKLLSEKEAIELDRKCRNNNVKFVYAINRGCFSMIFNDFGDEFVVYDTNGETPKSFVVSGLIENIFQLTDDNYCNLSEGDLVKFEEVVGLEELNYSTNGNKTFEITKRSAYTIEIGDLKQFTNGTYVKGGIITEVKKHMTLKMKSLEERFNDKGEISYTNSAKFDRLYPTVDLFHSLMVYLERFGTTPKTHNEEDYVNFKKIVEEVTNQNNEIDEKLIKMFCYGNNGFFSPLDTTIGGIAAQEVMKAASGKYTPYNQFVVYDCTEILPEKYLEMNESEFVDNGRYAGQIALIGKTVQKQLADSSMFLVGSGAIGCEVLKTWGMMGIATGEGVIHVTDNDCIEKSNLSRQFLFRNKHVGQSKSKTAADAVKVMNPDIHIVDYALRVGPATENIFNKTFYQKLSAITTALDNVQARNYVDSQCLKYKLPMIEAGTTGTKGNTQTIVPYLTQSYTTGSTRDPPEKSIPMCTLHNFPNNIDHTIQWARDRFEGWFKGEIEPVRCFNNEGMKYIDGLKESNTNFAEIYNNVKMIYENGLMNVPHNVKECIQWACEKYDTNYVNEIQRLIDLNPEDSLTDDGIPFWHAPKRFPHIVPFTKENETACEFIINATYLKAGIYGIPVDMTNEEIVDYCCSLSNEIKQNKKSNDLEEDCEMMTNAIKERSQEIATVIPVEFEKDDDTNHHIAFITAASNMRAENYTIAPADFMKTKMIAGKIIPAMITTTAVVSGLQCVEFIKVIQKKPFAQYQNYFMNLAIGYMDAAEPEEVIKKKIFDGLEVTIWDDFQMNGNCTMGEFIERIETQYGVDVDSIVVNDKIFYASFNSNAEEKKKMTFVEAFENVLKKKHDGDIMDVILAVSKEGVDDIDFPTIRLEFE